MRPKKVLRRPFRRKPCRGCLRTQRLCPTGGTGVQAHGHHQLDSRNAFQHILEFSDFLDGRYKAMMRELEKDPSDIEKNGGAGGLHQEHGDRLTRDQELIDEMRSMNAVLDDYFYRVEYSHFERQTSVALWPVKIQDQARIAEGVIAANRAKLLQDQIGEQAAFADALNDLQTFAFSFDQYTSLTQCTEAAANARDCMAQVEAPANSRASSTPAKSFLKGKSRTTPSWPPSRRSSSPTTSCGTRARTGSRRRRRGTPIRS